MTLLADTDAQSSELQALAPMTGETRWMTARVAPRTARLNASSLFTVTGRPESQEVVALDTATGKRNWTDVNDSGREGANRVGTGEQFVAAVTDDRVLVLQVFREDAPNRLEARAPDSGEVVWTVGGGADAPVPLGRPVVIGDRVYLVTRQNAANQQASPTLSIRDLQDGDEQMRAVMSPPSSGTFIAADRRLFFTTWLSRNSAGLTVR